MLYALCSMSTTNTLKNSCLITTHDLNSQDFVSQTVCVVDEAQAEKDAKAESQATWLTKRGFQYPKPKTRSELLTHPQRPSEARVEELQEQFRDAQVCIVCICICV
jgi:hypothetical protein